MKAPRQLKSALLILIYDGFNSLLKSIKNHLNYRFGTIGPDEVRIAFDILNAKENPGIMFDIGAHYGKSLSIFADNNWIVYAFEPDDRNRKRLFWSFGKRENVIIDSRAVSNTSQANARFYWSQLSSGISSLSPFHSSHQAGNRVSVITIEDFIKEKGLSEKQIDFMKIDTEGYDLFVLQGIPWSKVSPRLILCEFDNEKSTKLGYNFHDLATYLTAQGYRLIISEWQPLVEYGTPPKWHKFCIYPCSLDNNKSWGNIFASNDEHLFEILKDKLILASNN